MENYVEISCKVGENYFKFPKVIPESYSLIVQEILAKYPTTETRPLEVVLGIHSSGNTVVQVFHYFKKSGKIFKKPSNRSITDKALKQDIINIFIAFNVDMYTDGNKTATEYSRDYKKRY